MCILYTNKNIYIKLYYAMKSLILGKLRYAMESLILKKQDKKFIRIPSFYFIFLQLGICYFYMQYHLNHLFF